MAKHTRPAQKSDYKYRSSGWKGMPLADDNVDTSGTISNKQIQDFVRELKALQKSGRKIRIVK